MKVAFLNNSLYSKKKMKINIYMKNENFLNNFLSLPGILRDKNIHPIQ